MTLRLATFALTTLLSALASTAWADPGLTVTLNKVDETAQAPAWARWSSRKHLMACCSPSLTGLPPSACTASMRMKPSCASKERTAKVPALAAGGHFDPKKKQASMARRTKAISSDLPALYVDPQGQANQPVLAPRLTLADLADAH